MELDFTFLLVFSHQTAFFSKHSNRDQTGKQEESKGEWHTVFFHYFSINPQNSSFYFHLKEVLFWCKLLNLTWTTSFDMMLALGHTVFIFYFTTPHVQTCRCPFFTSAKGWKNLIQAGAWTYFAACDTSLRKNTTCGGWHIVRNV